MLVISPLPPGGSWASITVLEDGTLRFDSLYDPDLVSDLKAQIPATDRRAVYERRIFQYWAVAPQHAELLADLAEKHKMGRPQVPQIDVVEDVDWYDLAAKAAWEKGPPIPELPQVEDDPWDAVYKEEDAHDNDYMGRYPIDSDDLP